MTEAGIHYQRQAILDNFVIPWVPRQALIQLGELAGEEQLERHFDQLIFPHLPPVELAVRGIVDLFFLSMPSRWRLYITGRIKKIRNPGGQLKVRYPLDLEFNRGIRRLKEKMNAPDGFWQGKRAVACLSHDIDTADCYGFLPEIARIDLDNNIPAAVNVLTHADYNLDKGLLQDLIRSGFEIGYHGYRHELAMAMKDFSRLRKDFVRSIEHLRSLGVEVKGFRAPGFSVGTELLHLLDDLGFVYDSSMQLCNGHYHSCGISFPYKYPGRNFWEIPLALQDDLFFRDSSIEEQDVLRIAEEILQQTISLGGVFLFNFHPCLMKERVSFYERFLAMLQSHGDSLWITTPGNLCNLLNEKTRKVSQ